MNPNEAHVPMSEVKLNSFLLVLWQRSALGDQFPLAYLIILWVLT